VVEWDVEVISRLLFLLKWEVSALELEQRPAEWKGFFRAAVNLTYMDGSVRSHASLVFPGKTGRLSPLKGGRDDAMPAL
jgi:hypothetical protein